MELELVRQLREAHVDTRRLRPVRAAVAEQAFVSENLADFLETIEGLMLQSFVEKREAVGPGLGSPR
jgi:hypothetical protein